MLLFHIYFTLSVSALVGCEICSVCNCLFVNVTSFDGELYENVEIIDFTYKMEIQEPYNFNVTYTSLEKYLYVDCSNGRTLGQINNLVWPTLDVLGIFGNFRRSKWKMLEYLPEEIKKEMVVLSLSENDIVKVDQNELDDFKRLSALNLSQNHIEILRRSNFGKLNILKNLDLSQNAITLVEDSAFYGTKLHYLNLSRNFLTHLTSNFFDGLNYLLVLDLSENKLSTLSDDFGNQLQFLTVLSLTGNNFVKLPLLPKALKRIYLRRNQLVELHLHHSNLQVLDIGDNNVNSLANVNLPLLKVFKVDNNNLTSLHLKSNRITILDLSYNHFTAVPYDLTTENFSFLEKLYMDGNFLANISFPLQNKSFEYLKLLSFSNCSIGKLPRKVFKGIFAKNKQDCFNGGGITLNFSYNFINQLDDELFQNINFCSVDVSNNNLKTLSKSTFHWKEMFYLDLSRNPWHCDCSIQWMLDDFMTFMYKNYPRFLREFRCASPLRYKGKMLVFWYGKTENVFCKTEPSILSLDVISGKTIEMWTASAVACIVLGCIITCTIIIILILICVKPSKRTKKQKEGKRNLSNNYKPIQQNFSNRRDN